jgi:hypothetical protein
MYVNQLAEYLRAGPKYKVCLPSAEKASQPAPLGLLRHRWQHQKMTVLREQYLDLSLLIPSALDRTMSMTPTKLPQREFSQPPSCWLLPRIMAHE